MRWHRFAVLSGILVGLNSAGCKNFVENNIMGLDTANMDPRALVLAADDGPKDVTVSRFQKADQETAKITPPTPSLNTQPVLTGEAAKGQTIASIRAMVNDVPILDEEVRAAVATYLSGTRNLPEPERSRVQSEILHKALDQLVERELVIQDAKAKLNRAGKQVMDKVKEAAGKEFDRQIRDIKKQTGVTTDEEFLTMLRTQGVSLDGMRRQSERQFLAQEYLRSRIMPMIDEIGHEQILNYYNGHPEEFQINDSVKWQDIFIDGQKPGRSIDEARIFANDILKRIRAGADFNEFTKYDDGESGLARKGFGYGSQRGEIQPREAEPILFQLKDGQIGPLVEIPSGFHIIRLVKREFAGKMPFHEEKTQLAIRDKLRKEIANRESQRLIDDLKRKAQIEYCTTVP
jgi:parvulin-like peptidyl-prolyl isomerase